MDASLDRPVLETIERPRRLRSIFISDVHLGTRGCQAESLLDFLRHHEAARVYLVGDIVDCWRLRRGWYWPQAHNDVIQKLLRQARKGAQVFFIPGNHDEAARDYCGIQFGGVEIVRNMIHTAADGRKFLVIHGDEFDVVVRYARWLAFLGDSAYTLALFLNVQFNRIRRLLGFPYWSLSAWLKLKVKNAVNFIGEFEDTLAAAANRQGAQGVICGHIHHAAIRDIGGIRYMNTGDWVESCTALIETDEGRFEIVTWIAGQAAPKPRALAGVQAA